MSGTTLRMKDEYTDVQLRHKALNLYRNTSWMFNYTCLKYGEKPVETENRQSSSVSTCCSDVTKAANNQNGDWKDAKEKVSMN